MPEPFHFADTLRFYVARTAYSSGQLSNLAELPRTTIVNWLNGRVQRPREWQPVVRLLAVLHLEEKEADEVLQAANQPTIAELRLLARGEEEKGLLRSWERPPQPAKPPFRPPFQAVADTAYFVGRQTILAQLKSKLLNGSICTLVGMAGTGKTAVAARLAYQLRSHFPDGVLWARLDTSDTMMILHTFARAYGADVSHYDDAASRSRVVRDLLSDKRALIVLDNATDSAGVEPLLPPTGQCAVLITTRRHDLRVAQGVSRFTLEPFQADGEASRELFAHFLGAERVRADAGPLAEIAACVGHLPLALTIVAGRLAYEPGWSTADFLARLQQDSRRLKELQSEDQNVRLSFAASYSLLPEEVKSFFTALSLFAGKDFTPEAAAAAAGMGVAEAEDYLRMLYRLSLVQSGRMGRYQLHPLLNDFAREQAPDTLHWTPLATYYVNFLGKHDLGEEGVALESENILTVINGSRENGERAAAVQLITAFAPFLKLRGMYDVAQRQLLYAVEVTPEEQRLPVLLQLARIVRYYRRYGEAEEYLETAAILAQEQHDSFALSAIEAERGIIAGCRGEYGRARSHFQEGLALSRQQGQSPLLVQLLKELGASEVAHGNYEAAEGHYQEALGMAQQMSPVNVPALLRCLGGLAIIRDRDFDRAAVLYNEGLAKARTMNSQEEIVTFLNNLAVVAFQQGRSREAKALLAEGLELSRKLLYSVGAGMILGNRGRLALNEREWETAERYLADALEVVSAAAHHEMIAAVQKSQRLLAEARQAGRQMENDPRMTERLKIFYD